MCAFMRSLVHVSTGPTDRSPKFRFAANAFSRSSRPARDYIVTRSRCKCHCVLDSRSVHKGYRPKALLTSER